MDYEILMNNNLKIGMQAPDFEAITTNGNIRFSDYIGKWVVLFSHPGAFTPVCTTEFLAFQKMITYFNDRNTCLLGLSVDSNASHIAWLNNIKQTTNVEITFPIIADKDSSIARKYGMIAPEVSNVETVRNVYIIDDKQIIRSILIYPLTNGRYIPEIVRLIDCLQLTDKENVYTPANWVPGNAVIAKPPKTFLNSKKNINNTDYECVDWYLCMKKINNKDERQENKK
ncbi:MAG: peroxiredoxin [Clostridiales bacterium]|nr:peroxiredoxin [Clostridiales bacterium]